MVKDIAIKIKCYKNTYYKIKDFKLIITRANKIQNKNELHNKLIQDGVGLNISSLLKVLITKINF